MMKTFLFTVLILFVTTTNAQNSEKELLGTWTGSVHGQAMVLSFFDNSMASWKVGDIFNMGKGQLTFDGETKNGSLLYEISIDSNHFNVDLIMYNPKTGSRFNFPCLAQFVDNNTLKLAVGEFKGSRPINFKNHVVLARK